jgi:geranylgeranyl pyrophosphate synthase
MDFFYKEIDNYIMNIQINDYPELIQSKVSYLLDGGKRLRPLLCLIFSSYHKIYDSIGSIEKNKYIENKKNVIYKIASHIELIHSLSLVLDDLPEMDDDNMRRNKESFHCKYGKEYTNFFIYYIFNHIPLSLDSVLNADYSDGNNNFKTDLLNINIAKKIYNIFQYNLNLLIDGQYNDLNYHLNKNTDKEKEEYNKKENGLLNIYLKEKKQKQYINKQFCDEKIIIMLLLDYNSLTDELHENIDLNIRKTSSLFNLSITVGFLLYIWLLEIDESSNDENTIWIDNIYKKLTTWSNIFGFIFQISDDILDMDDDIKKGNPNICHIIGKDYTSILLEEGCEWLTIQIESINMDIRNKCMDNKTNCMNVGFNLDAINEIITKISNRIV